jgi:tripartite-type tricarboxylate transporter receptor subunit TctC
MKKAQGRLLAVAALICLAFGGSASLAATEGAQEGDTAYPTRTIKFVVPYAPGGFPDTVARIIAQRLHEQMGQPCIVENRPGAGGLVAGDFVAKSPPDGYTLLLTDAQVWGITPATTKSLPFDPLNDLAAVSILAAGSNFLTVGSTLPVANFSEFVALVKANPGKFNYGSAGVGSVHHLAMEALKAEAGLDIVHIPYKGSSQVTPALLTGEVSAAIITLSTLLPHWEKGTVKVLGVATPKRSPAAPNVPTITELGVNGVEFASAVGVLAPAATPPAIISKLAFELGKAVRNPDTVDRFVKIGIEPVGSTAPQAKALVQSEFVKYAKAVRSAGLEPK